MKIVKWEDLNDACKKDVLARYVYRHTAIGEGKHYKTEHDWCIDHAFHVTKEGRLSNKHKFCEPSFIAS